MSGDLLIFYKTLALANERNLYMKEKKATRRISSVLLALLLCIAMLPTGVFADNEGNITSDQSQEIAAEAADAQSNDAASEELTFGAEGADAANAENEKCPPHASVRTIPRKEPNCARSGNIEYYQCSDCAKKFLDKECSKEVTDDSIITLPIDPNAHKWGAWVITRKATPEQKGERTRACELCDQTQTEEYTDPGLTKNVKLSGVNLQFKSEVYKKADSDSSLIPGRTWIKGNKTSMSVNWKNPSNRDAVDGVIILRATGKVDSDTVFKEVARASLEKTSYVDKTNIKKNKIYTYRVISYYELDGITYISKLSKNDWAAGQTSESKLKNVYKATMNKSTAKLQSNETIALKLNVANPKTKYAPTSVRWTSSNTDVAKVSSKGKVRTKAPGTATIRGRLASGYEFSSKITVVGAYKPGKVKLEVDYATTSSITLKWSKAKYATSYQVYKSNDGLHWDKTPKSTKKTTTTFKDLKKNHRYTFYVVAVNSNKGLDKDGNDKTYKAYGDNSNVLNQKAVVKRRPMTLTGFPTAKAAKTGSTISVTVSVNPPLGRKAQLQMKSGKKWINKKTVVLPKGTSKKSVTFTIPNDWWGKTTEWRLVVPPTTTTSGFTTKTLTIKAERAYQNPSGYVQLSSKISKHGYKHYVSPVLVNDSSSRANHIEALIKTANKYKGDRYVQSRSGAPGKGIDESGLVIQACYGAGADLWPISPSTRPYNCVPKIMSSKLGKVSYGEPTKNDFPNVYRGDLIFFAESKGGTAISVAIYTGYGGVIIADAKKGVVRTTNLMTLLDENKYVIVGVRRIFN